MIPRPEIPPKAIYRLSVYLRCLHQLEKSSVQTVSSEDLAKAAGVKPTQLRKDLSYFGQVGTRGLGYYVDQLAEMITDLLGTASLQPVILVGVGNLGSALLSYKRFEEEGFQVVAAFDEVVSPSRQNQIVQQVYPMNDLPAYVTERDIKLAILTVPSISAQGVVNSLVAAGITGILNLSPSVVQVPEEITVHDVNLAIELETLSYFIQS